MSRNRPLETSAAHIEQSASNRHRVDVTAQFLTGAQICRRLGICDETWRRWRKAGRAPLPAPLPGRKRWAIRDIERFERGAQQPVSRMFVHAAQSEVWSR